MTTIIILIIIYLFSYYMTWRYIHIAYSKEGIWSGSVVGFGNILLTVLPVINTLVFIIFNLCGSPYEAKHNKFIDKLFKIEK